MATKPSRWKVAWTAGRLASRRLLRRRDGARDAELADVLTGQLDEMKGLAMKLGQIASYMDVPLPASVQERLAQLQTGIAGLSAAQTRAGLTEALGNDFEQRFDTLDLEPFAAASIGQVHRARVAGRAVVLKLRYPDVAASFSRDLGAVDTIASLASLATAIDGRALVAELGARLAEECDYAREAADQAAFARAFASDPSIDIPEVLPEFTTASTLVTAFASGSSFDAACEQPAAIRNAYAAALVRFSYRCLLQLSMIQADPHPGNFLFGPGERVTFLDFGCVRRFSAPFVDGLRRLILAVDRDDRAAFREAMVDLQLVAKPDRFDFDYAFGMMEHLHRPLLQSHFEFTPAYVEQGLAYNGPRNPNARHMNLPPPYIWVARLQWGLWSVLTRLRASLGLRDELEQILAGVDEEPAPRAASANGG